MRYKTFLLEYHHAKTVERFGDRLRDRFIKELTHDDGSGNVGDFLIMHLAQFVPGFKITKNRPLADLVLDFLEGVDPTAKNAYVPAMARWYAMGSMKRLEDALKIKAAIPIIQKFMNRLQGFNPMQITFDEFLDKADELQGARSKSEIAKEEEDAFFNSGAAEVYIDIPAMKVVIPKTEEAAKYFGRGTRWCTAAMNDNMFDYYNRDGPLFCILFRGENKKWQFHFESDQFMDERDDNLDENTSQFKNVMVHFKPYIDDALYEALAKDADKPLSMVRFLSPAEISEDLAQDIIDRNPDNIRFLPQTDEYWKLAIDVDASVIRYLPTGQEPGHIIRMALVADPVAIKWIKDPAPWMQVLAVEQDPTLLWVIASRGWEIAEEAALVAVKQSGVAIGNVKNPSPEVQMAAVKNELSALQYIDNPTPAVVAYCINKDPTTVVFIKRTKDNIGKLTPDMQLKIVRNNHNNIRFIPNPTPEAVKLAKKGENAHIRIRRDAYRDAGYI